MARPGRRCPGADSGRQLFFVFCFFLPLPELSSLLLANCTHPEPEAQKRRREARAGPAEPYQLLNQAGGTGREGSDPGILPASPGATCHWSLGAPNQRSGVGTGEPPCLPRLRGRPSPCSPSPRQEQRPEAAEMGAEPGQVHAPREGCWGRGTALTRPKPPSLTALTPYGSRQGRDAPGSGAALPPARQPSPRAGSAP